MLDVEFDCSKDDLKQVLQEIANRVVCSVKDISVKRNINRYGNDYYYTSCPGVSSELHLKRLNDSMEGFYKRGVVSYFRLHW